MRVDEEGWIVDPSAGDQTNAERSENKENADANGAATGSKKPPKVPRVYYATRTHSQIQQVVR